MMVLGNVYIAEFGVPGDVGQHWFEAEPEPIDLTDPVVDLHDDAVVIDLRAAEAVHAQAQTTD